MPVFISHRTADDPLARQVRDRLVNLHGIQCYLDDLDQQTKVANQITSLIVSRLNGCTNLLALVTPNTRGSWWVPFEVGVARQAPRMITSYTNLPQSDLPEYLTEWPVLRGNNAIDLFAAAYKRQVVMVKRAFVDRTFSATAAEGIASINAFHQNLKIALEQR